MRYMDVNGFFIKAKRVKEESKPARDLFDIYDLLCWSMWFAEKAGYKRARDWFSVPSGRV